MTIINIYNEAEVGFDMPSSAEQGYILTDAIGHFGALGPVLFDNGSLIIIKVINNPVLDQVTAVYSVVGDTVRIYDIEYSNSNEYRVIEFLGVNLVGSKADLEIGNIFHTAITESNDTLGGNDYSDVIFGGPGDDIVVGYAGDDHLSGDSGADFLSGLKGKDKLFGESGSDVLKGGQDKDKLYGGPEYDSFLFDKGYGNDQIKDFELKVDDIWIDRDLANSFKQIKKVADKYNDGVILDFKKDDSLKIEGLKLDKLDKVHFEFYDLV